MNSDNDIDRKRIDSSPEIESLLRTYLLNLDADAAILFRYMKSEDIEVSELLSLISISSQVVNDPSFYEKVIDEEKFKNLIFENEDPLDFIEDQGEVRLELENKFKRLRDEFCDVNEDIKKKNEKIRLEQQLPDFEEKKIVKNKDDDKELLNTLPAIKWRMFDKTKSYKDYLEEKNRIRYYNDEVERLNKDLRDDEKFRYLEPLQELLSTLRIIVTAYNLGCLKSDEESNKRISKLKEFIWILKFSGIVERINGKSRWAFDYMHRPPKYLIYDRKIIHRIYHEQKPILREGITSYFCRTNAKPFALKEDPKKGIYFFPKETFFDELPNNQINSEKERIKCNLSMVMSRNAINACDGHARFAEDSQTFNNYSSHHAGWIMLNKEPDRTDKYTGYNVGCFRLEYYTDGDTSPKQWGKERGLLCQDILDKYNAISNKALFDFTADQVHGIFEEKYKKSYDAIYNCLDPIMRKVIRVGCAVRKSIYLVNKKKDDKEIVDEKTDKEKADSEDIKEKADMANLLELQLIIEHLFFVLKRNTYYGEAIVDRINKSIIGILESLNLPSDIFSNIWNELRRHEDLMLYDLESYRDHVMHQFHVFILGYILIYSYGLETLRAQVQTLYGEFIESYEPGIKKFTKTDILRLWTLISLFHDCGYAFEKLPQGFEKFSKRILKAKLKSEFNWDEVILGDEYVSELVQRMSRFYRSCPVYNPGFANSSILRILLKNAVLENDHGVMSAIILEKQYLDYINGFPGVDRISALINIATLTISLHNTRMFETVAKHCCQPICMVSNPFLFILVYCDTAQEWGRQKQFTESASVVIPELKRIESSEISLEKKCNSRMRFAVELEYGVESFGKPPKPNDIIEYVYPVVAAFETFRNYIFKIKYNIRHNRVVSFTERFHTCGVICKLLARIRRSAES